MSKYVKDLVANDIRQRLQGVQDALLVNIVGLDAGKTVVLRKKLRDKGIHLLAVKNSLAARATEGTPLAAAFRGAEGTLAMVWGAQDFVSLAKEITAIDRSEEFAPFQTRGGVMEGEALTPERVKQISKWPNRQEQLSLLILGVGARLVSQLASPAGALASQIEQKSKESES
jgi:large subunit ribosomal protein L10